MVKQSESHVWIQSKQNYLSFYQWYLSKGQCKYSFKSLHTWQSLGIPVQRWFSLAVSFADNACVVCSSQWKCPLQSFEVKVGLTSRWAIIEEFLVSKSWVFCECNRQVGRGECKTQTIAWSNIKAWVGRNLWKKKRWLIGTCYQEYRTYAIATATTTTTLSATVTFIVTI